jgi:hypothetical protein
MAAPAVETWATELVAETGAAVEEGAGVVPGTVVVDAEPEGATEDEATGAPEEDSWGGTAGPEEAGGAPTGVDAGGARLDGAGSTDDTGGGGA